MELNYWSKTECTNARFDDASQEWVVEVVRDGEPVTLRPKQLVFALGVSGYPNVPTFDGAESFMGQQYHSSKHPGGGDWTGKKAVVIGSNNSAHDICADLWEHGADVTMVQRSSTHIARSESLMDLALGDLYSERALQTVSRPKRPTSCSRRFHTGSCPRPRSPCTRRWPSVTPGSTPSWKPPALTWTSVWTAQACSSSTCGGAQAITSTSAPRSCLSTDG
ncbi:probable indole-3-pyruvate monooxygenase YUCCA10 [Arthrobacter sp. Hiyo6]|nr:probable indole-3-pyruvate monooxygenase YUCCA10 [Arthrobacter sp. Hiyo6]